jgi:hypothetical protein
MDHSYGVDSNLTLRCELHTYHVHREILSQASPFFMSLLEGPFVEASTDIITLEGDDPVSLKIVIDIIYLGILATRTFNPNQDLNVDTVGVDTIINKYDLAGVRNIINLSCEMKSVRVRESEVENHLKKLKKHKPGFLVAVAVITLTVLITGPLITLAIVPVVISIAVVTVVLHTLHMLNMFFMQCFIHCISFIILYMYLFCNALMNCMSS